MQKPFTQEMQQVSENLLSDSHTFMPPWNSWYIQNIGIRVMKKIHNKLTLPEDIHYFNL